MSLVPTCEICGYKHTRSNAVKIWRKHGYGRLYWKHKNRRMQGWQRDDIAQVKNGVLRIYFTSNEAIIHDALGIMVDTVIAIVDEYAYQDEWRNEGREIGDTQ